jgi:hypothetical protein
MLTDLAPEVFQFSVEDSPAEILDGLASKELITGNSTLAGAQPGMRKADDIRTRQSTAKNLFMYLPPERSTFYSATTNAWCQLYACSYALQWGVMRFL